MNKFTDAGLLSLAIFGGVRLDGTNDYYVGPMSGMSDGRTGTIAFDLTCRQNFTSNTYLLGNTGDTASIIFTNIGNLRVLMRTSAPANVVLLMSSSTYQSGDRVQCVASWSEANGGTMWVSKNGGAWAEEDTDATVTADIDYTVANYSIGATTSGTSPIAADIRFLYFNTAEEVLASVEGNRGKFFDSGGNPVFRGFDGSLPTGTAPAIDLGGKFDAFDLNAGTGGDLTMIGAPGSLGLYHALTGRAYREDGALYYHQVAANQVPSVCPILSGIAYSPDGAVMTTTETPGNDSYYVRGVRVRYDGALHIRYTGADATTWHHPEWGSVNADGSVNVSVS